MLWYGSVRINLSELHVALFYVHSIAASSTLSSARPLNRILVLSRYHRSLTLSDLCILPHTWHIRTYGTTARLVFHPDLPSAAFIGFCRGGVGSIMQGIEMQSRWAALVCSGKRRLPASAEMKASIDRSIHTRSHVVL